MGVFFYAIFKSFGKALKHSAPAQKPINNIITKHKDFSITSE
jgi:hypothetical protein